VGLQALKLGQATVLIIEDTRGSVIELIVSAQLPKPSKSMTALSGGAIPSQLLYSLKLISYWLLPRQV
jgi:hypothetical protein